MVNRQDSGFTLLETIVALTLFALVAGAFQLCLAGGWKGIRLTDMQRSALQVAQAQLALPSKSGNVVEGVEEGVDERGFRWTLETSLYAPGGTESGTSSGIAGYWLRVTVRWRDSALLPERMVELSTLKLGRAK